MRPFVRAVRVLQWLLFAATFWCGAPIARAAEVVPLGTPTYHTISAGPDWIVLAWAARGSGLPNLTQANPGELITVTVLVQGLQNQAGIPLRTFGENTLLSVTGAKLEPGANVTYPDGVNAVFYDVLPFTFGGGAFRGPQSGATVRLRVNNLNKKGKGDPVRLNVRLQQTFGDNPLTSDITEATRSLDSVLTLQLPVSDAPPLNLSARLFSTHPGELRPGGTGTIQYTVETPDSTMDELSFRVRLPKGTTLTPGTVSPVDGVVQGNEITWTVRGGGSRFNASVGIRVKSRPGTKKTIAKYSAIVVSRGFRRTGVEQLAIPIPALDRGSIVYYGDTGQGGAVKVGGTYPFVCEGWDPDGGDIVVSLNDVGVTTVPVTAAYGTFSVPPFRDPDLEHVLSARQTGKPVDTVVTGLPDADVEFATGNVQVIGGDGTFYRRLSTGRQLAVGEMDVDRDSIGKSNRFGLVQIDGASSAALIRKSGSDTRLLYARGGDVAIYGDIKVGRLVVQIGKGVKTINFTANGDFSGYDTAGKPDLTLFIPSASGPPEVSGFARGTNFSRVGPFLVSGAIFYIEGDGDFDGDITGGGTLITTGDFTHHGRFQFSGSGLTLGVGGTFSTLR